MLDGWRNGLRAMKNKIIKKRIDVEADIRETAKALADMEKPKKKRGGKRKPLPVVEILKMKKAGCTVQQIADRFGCARSHVYAEWKKVSQ